MVGNVLILPVLALREQSTKTLASLGRHARQANSAFVVGIGKAELPNRVCYAAYFVEWRTLAEA